MFTNPLKNLKAFEIRETDIVADLGAGTGFYSILAAEIASAGKVYAVEINNDFLETIRNKAKEAKLSNIECLHGDVEKVGGSKIGDGVVDKVIASNVFFQVTEKNNLVSEIRRIIKDKGKVLVIDWDAASPIPHKGGLISKDKVKEMFAKGGFTLEREIDAGMHHYGIIFNKN